MFRCLDRDEDAGLTLVADLAPDGTSTGHTEWVPTDAPWRALRLRAWSPWPRTTGRGGKRTDAAGAKVAMRPPPRELEIGVVAARDLAVGEVPRCRRGCRTGETGTRARAPRGSLRDEWNRHCPGAPPEIGSLRVEMELPLSVDIPSRSCCASPRC